MKAHVKSHGTELFLVMKCKAMVTTLGERSWDKAVGQHSPGSLPTKHPHSWSADSSLLVLFKEGIPTSLVAYFL